MPQNLMSDATRLSGRSARPADGYERLGFSGEQMFVLRWGTAAPRWEKALQKSHVQPKLREGASALAEQQASHCEVTAGPRSKLFLKSETPAPQRLTPVLSDDIMPRGEAAQRIVTGGAKRSV